MYVDDAVNAYERGAKLKNLCQVRLNEARMKVEKIKDFDKEDKLTNVAEEYKTEKISKTKKAIKKKDNKSELDTPEEVES